MVSSAKAGEQVCGLAWLPGWVLTQGSGLALLLGQLWFSGQSYLWGNIGSLCSEYILCCLPSSEGDNSGNCTCSLEILKLLKSCY